MIHQAGRARLAASSPAGSGPSSPSPGDEASGAALPFQDAAAASIVVQGSVASSHRGQAITHSCVTASTTAGPATGG